MKNKTEVKKRFDKLIMLLIKNKITTKIVCDHVKDENEFIGNIYEISVLHFINNKIETEHDIVYPRIILGKAFTNVMDALIYICEYEEDILKELYEKLDEKHNPNIDYIEYILTKLTRRDILDQLAEEASEVANVGHDISMSASFITQYAIKNIRATEDTENKTPEDIKNINDQIQGNVAILNSTKNKALEEECGDLNMCLDLLYHLDGNHPIEEFNTLDNSKWKRWAERLGFINF